MKILYIPDYPDYCAGEDGNVYSYWIRAGKHSRIDFYKVPLRLKGRINNSGYYHVSLKDLFGKRKSRFIHTTICELFRGPRPSKEHTASHQDGNSLNNKADNLMWETRSDNNSRKKLHGTDDVGYHNTRAKLTKDQLLEVRNLLAEGKLNHTEIGKLFNVSRNFITKINVGHRYKGL